MRGAILGIAAACLFALTAEALAIGQATYVESVRTPGSFPIVQAEGAATIYVDSGDWPGVIRAVKDLQSDIERVTGRQATISDDAGSLKGYVIIMGTIGRSKVVDDLARAGKIDTSRTVGKWESFFLQVVPDALPNVDAALIIAGSDKRGTIYGVYDLSEQMGVSPWYWWADVPIRHKDELYVKTGKYERGEPSVKYRGIFLNDEAPDLSGWVAEKFGYVPRRDDPPVPGGVANYNSAFYSRIFEVILRLRGNYLWPAMWNNAFNEDDPNNPRLADEYGIVMGTTHQEPMLRAQKEWDRRYQRTLGSWNYYKNPDVLQEFWRAGIRRNKNYESIITLGLRGANDTPMIPGGTVAQSMALLEEIVAVQRKMIADEINPDVTKVPQLWCLYKEVQEFYNAGLRVPDDVTLLWAEDNWGNVRRLPTPQERKRSGGAGVYYHFDYVGGPRNYKWINTNPIPKVWEQLTLAKEYGADRIWIVNVGHFKGLEFPMEFFMHLAWNTKRWTNENLDEYTRLWASREFGPTYADAIAEIISKYTKYNGRRKPELLEPTTYSLTSYREADTVVADFKAIAAKAEEIHGKVPHDARDAFYELVLFPTKACSQVNELYVTAGKNALYARQGRATANDMADQVEQLFKADADLMDYYNHTFAGGKWNHFMDQVHIGYTIWQDPPRNVMPRLTRIELPQAAAMGVAVEGSSLAWPGAPGDPCLPRFDAFNRQRFYIDIFNRGQASFEYTATTASEPWVVLSAYSGTIAKEQRLWVSVDWARAPKGSAAGTVKVTRAGGESVTVRVESFHPTVVTRETLDGFVEGQGYVSIEAEHYTKNVPAGPVRWAKIEDYGRTLSAMTILPVTAASVAAPPPSGVIPAEGGWATKPPCLEYRMYLFDPHSVKVLAIVAPTLNFVPDRALRYAVSFDDQPPQVIDIVPKGFDARNGNRDWEESVKNSCRIVQSAHTLSTGGYHTLKVWMVDPGVILQKIVVDLGGLRPNYLGPPESYRSAGGR
ncbi:MAG: glycosyl hydrolase 115 family protein [Sedimentisphaerales bacterium]|nr:glycosyl hydrolase 115 family protein [Sedimentisphaerales bacterium]